MPDTNTIALGLLFGLYIMAMLSWATMLYQTRHFRRMERHCADVVRQMKETHAQVIRMISAIEKGPP